MLATARAINGTDFDGTAAITVTAAAGTLTGTTLNATVVTSSLTSVGTLAASLLFVDATHDIGASGATRPRDLFLSRNALMGGTLGVTGLVTASGGLTVASGQTLTVTGATITGLTAASVGAGTFPGAVTAGAGLTVTSGQTLTVTGVTVTGLTAASVAGGTFPSGTFTFTNPIGIGDAVVAGQTSRFAPSQSDASVLGVTCDPTATAASGEARGITARVRLSGSFTCPSVQAIRVLNTTLAGGAVATLNHGIYVDAITGGGTNYAIYTNAGSVRLGALAGSGTRTVVVDANGVLSAP